MGIKGWLLAVSAVGLAALLLPPPPPDAHMPHRKPVYFWHPWSGDFEPYLIKACERFNASQTEHEVIPVFTPNGGGDTKFLLSEAGGEGPDLVVQWGAVTGPWTDQGLLRPIDSVMTHEERARYDAEAYPIAKKYSTYHGKYMCVVPGVDSYAVYYRLDDLKEVGRDENSLPTTLDDLVALGKKLDRRDKDGNLRRIGFLPEGLFNWAPSFGGGFETEGGVHMDTPENRRALNFIVGQVKRLGLDNVTRFTSSQPADVGANAPLLTGNMSIMVDGQWKVKQAEDYAPKGFRFAVAPIPPPKGGVAMATNSSSNFLFIPAASKNPEGAWAFIKFWMGFDNPEEGARNSIEMGWIPYSRKVVHCKVYQDYLAKHPQFKPFVALIEGSHVELAPVGPLQKFVLDEITKADDLATHLSVTPERALADLERNVKHEYARQRRLGNVR